MMGKKAHNENFIPSFAVVSPILTSVDSSEDFRSIEDQAELLLSISDIARCEIKAHPLALQDDTYPMFPSFRGNQKQPMVTSLTPRTPAPHSIRSLLFPSLTAKSSSKRLRSVSIDINPSHRCNEEDPQPSRATSPPTTTPGVLLPLVSPPCSKRTTTSFRSTRLSQKARRDNKKTLSKPQEEEELPQGKPLQCKPPRGIPITKIRRRKFSWKNYPELEEFLVANREEYLRHSAMNYTLQQKQYNNRLTERLLELSTEFGYLFDRADFTFVTVRDRIRCYYKSYVQSAKKRGVLMGYAARKAGLLTEQELMQGGAFGEIVTPGENHD